MLLKASPNCGLVHQQHHIESSCILQTSNSTTVCFSPKPIWSLFLKTQNVGKQRSLKKKGLRVEASASSSNGNLNWESWKPLEGCCSLSEIVWPSAGAFAAMAILGKIDQLVASKGISMSIAPLGAVSAVLFLTPSSPAARKYNMFMAQIGCAAIGVLAFSILGPGWLARSAALAASIAFMIYTRSPHPPAASLPILFIDGVKLHHLNYWYVLFPGAAGCILLCLIQEIVIYLKDNIKF
ncbi:Integral membrane HPP family protein [Euphorbia peplus]|nr:Integral membrane HPP family protein [Euphorbia peplus]